MEFLKLLASIHNPVLDFFFYAITFLGDEICFMAIAITIFWCVDKRGGYYVLITGLIGTVINQGLKLLFRIERPWVLDKSFEVSAELRETAGGYSFPSGHTQNIAGTFGSIFAFFKRNWLRIVSIVIIILVSFSRMYLGVHTPLDVLTSLGIALVLVCVLYPVFSNEERFHRLMPYVIGVCAALSLALLIYVNCLPVSDFPTEEDIANLNSGRKNAATLFGCLLGLVVVYPIDRLFFNFKTDAPWYCQLVKVAGGLGGVLLIKELGKVLFGAVLGLFIEKPEYIARAIAYFLVVIFAGIVWPLTFGFFSRLRPRFMEKFTDWVYSLFGKTRHAPTPSGEDEAENLI